MDEEIWKPISGFENLYEVSNKGRVRSLPREIINRDGSYRTYKGKILNPQTRNHHYYNTSLRKNNKAYPKRVHRIVMETFCYFDGCSMYEVNHINGDRFDNRLENLEWCTRQENSQHAVENNLYSSGFDLHNTKLSDQDVVDIRERYIPYSKDHSLSKIAKDYNISFQHVSRIVNYKVRGGGYVD